MIQVIWFELACSVGAISGSAVLSAAIAATTMLSAAHATPTSHTVAKSRRVAGAAVGVCMCSLRSRGADLVANIHRGIIVWSIVQLWPSIHSDLHVFCSTTDLSDAQRQVFVTPDHDARHPAR